MSADEIKTEAKKRLTDMLEEKRSYFEVLLKERKVEEKMAKIRENIERRADEPVFVQLDLSPDASAEQINNAYRLTSKLIGLLETEDG